MKGESKKRGGGRTKAVTVEKAIKKSAKASTESKASAGGDEKPRRGHAVGKKLGANVKRTSEGLECLKCALRVHVIDGVKQKEAAEKYDAQLHDIEDYGGVIKKLLEYGADDVVVATSLLQQDVAEPGSTDSQEQVGALSGQDNYLSKMKAIIADCFVHEDDQRRHKLQCLERIFTRMAAAAQRRLQRFRLTRRLLEPVFPSVVQWKVAEFLVGKMKR